MTYRRSRARLEFEQQLNQTLSEVQQLNPHGLSNGISRLLGAYYVFAFSQFEVYVKDIIEDSLQALNAAAPAFADVPDLMLGYLLHRGEDLGPEYRRFAISEDEGALLQKLATTGRKLAQWGAGGPPIVLDAAVFLDKKKYPSPKNLPQLFKRLGVNNLWASVSATGKFDSKLILTSLNDLRTSIAHDGRVPPGFSIPDFKDRLSKMRRFVGALDRALASHFCSNAVPRQVWNQAMG